MAEPVVPAAGGTSVYRDRQLVVTRTERPAGLRFVGEIDVANSYAISEALRQIIQELPNPHLDLTSLVFSDVASIKALVSVAEFVGSERRLLLHGLAPELERVMGVIGWSERAGFSFCGCTGIDA